MATKLAVTGLAVVGMILHLAVPHVNLDLVTLGLVVVAIAPWLRPVVKSFELPGGFKVELQDVQRVTRNVEAITVADTPGGSGSRSGIDDSTAHGLDQRLDNLRYLAGHDPNVALVALRIEIEQMLRNIARGHNLLWERKSAGQLLALLRQKDILAADLAGALAELIHFGNQAAHGASVSRDAAIWAVNHAPAVLYGLTGYLGD